MERNRTLATIRNDIERHVGEKVTLKANGGRKKILVNDGIIESVHPSIFALFRCSRTEALSAERSEVGVTPLE